MKPTIGRIVIYNLTEEDKSHIRLNDAIERTNECEQLPAIVTNVFEEVGETVANLKVIMDGTQKDLWKCSVKECHNETPVKGFWNWPLIQK